MTTRHVLSVGQCGFDHSSISRFLRQAIGARVEPVPSSEEALSALRADPSRYDLVLVNRVFDSGGSGIDLIRSIRQDAALAGVPVMLVSDHQDAQRQAVALGALPGFGKSQLGDPTTADRLKDALACPGGS
ncbi:response regulator transcription factor [Tautonia sociabilis]|uniref:Response regulator transcription factor n=2 Tax=Tautonia sociabilis TaxID=2080755 RepID=A0A432MGP7_9BACT|nr:response regulator transcription factor [Tautonia sociabilis]RUL85641.1 response regulator transcription factor [Tautonia sociabilis]